MGYYVWFSLVQNVAYSKTCVSQKRHTVTNACHKTWHTLAQVCLLSDSDGVGMRVCLMYLAWSLHKTGVHPISLEQTTILLKYGLQCITKVPFRQ